MVDVDDITGGVGRVEVLARSQSLLHSIAVFVEDPGLRGGLLGLLLQTVVLVTTEAP